MKKALVIILLAAGALSACRIQDTEMKQPTVPLQEVIVQDEIESVEAVSILDYPTPETQPNGPEHVSKDLSEESEGTEPPVENTVVNPTKPTESRQESKPEPQPTEATLPSDPLPTVTVPTETNPVPTEPQEVIPEETVPETSVPPTTEPPVTEPPATEPPVTEPSETEPKAEEIDTSALEAYGRSYASSTYGYNGTSACTTGSGAGYFPAATKRINSMDEGYSLVRQAVDSQYKRDQAYGYLPYEEIDGKIVRCPINVQVSSTDEANVFTITVYYGGSA